MKSSLKIISGGQTGSDRAALEWALANGVPHGGWCPADRKAEDGHIPQQFQLTETRAATYAVRTRWNVRDSDGTVICSMNGRLKGGSVLTVETAERQGKPMLHLMVTEGANKCARRLDEFIKHNSIAILNIAGPRVSEEPGIGDFVKAVLSQARSFR